MIVDLILTVLFGIVNILLAPLTVINIAVDFVGSMPIVYQFVEVVAYILPWENLLPLVILIHAIFIFRIVISLIKNIWQLIPGL